MKIWGHKLRLFCIFAFFILILAILIWRMYDLMIMDRKFLLGQGDARSLRMLDIPAYRGMIIDREGAPLAVSTPVQSIWINPKSFSPTVAQLSKLVRLLGISSSHLSKIVSSAHRREFVYLQRQLPPEFAKKIEDLKVPGVNLQEEFKRYYPDGDSTAQLIGFTNVDDNGIEGLELAYQQWLVGVSGKKKVVRDRQGRVIEELQVEKEPRPGNLLQLSIDRRIQFFAYHELENTVLKFGAKSGSVVVLDTENGEVLAVANYPSFNPNARFRYKKDSYRNKAITDTYEPGSVIKPFSIASALLSGKFKPDTVIDTNPSWMVVNGRMIRDIHNYGVLDVVGVLKKSSNVGVTKMVLASPPEQLIGLLKKVGIGEKTESGYPGESEGGMIKLKEASPFVLATLGFGYGMSVTTMQLAKAYLVFANHGDILPVSLLHNDEPVSKKQIIDATVADQVLNMMEAVVGEEGGTGKDAQVPGYRIAGKTGTARIAGVGGYKEKRYISSFVGIAPVSNPKIIVAVVIHEPTRLGYYAAAVAAPLFSKIMGTTLRILDIPPDKTIKSS